MARFETERTYVMIKPDGVQRGVVGNIISRFEAKGFVLKGLKLFQCPKALAEEHYKVSVCARAKFAREPVSCLGDKRCGLVAHSHLFCLCRRNPRTQDLSAKPFFKDLVSYICSGPVVAMVRTRHFRPTLCDNSHSWRVTPGVGGPRRCEERAQDHRRHESAGGGARHHPRRPGR